jgi:hypothetical protein
MPGVDMTRGGSEMSELQSVSAETPRAILDAFNAHDLDAIMEFFADDCSLDMPRGPDPWGQRFVGKAAVREGLASFCRETRFCEQICGVFGRESLRRSSRRGGIGP